MSKGFPMKKVDMKNCLYQRFYIIGLDIDMIISDELYIHPFSKEIIPKIISKFPPLPYSYCTIPDQLIIHHCFPGGYALQNMKMPSQIFSFTLDNFPIHLIQGKEFKSAYFTCCLFYETLSNYHKIKEKYYTFKELNEESSSSSLANTSQENLRQSYSSIFVPKVLCLMSVLPFYSETVSILRKLINNYSFPSRLISFPIEKQIEDIIFSIPIPQRGSCPIVYKFKDEVITFPLSAINKMPNPSNDLQILLDCLEVKQLILIFKGLLLEVPILIFSLQREKLTNIVESLISLLYPFNYQYPHISILPTNCFSLIEYYDAFILGINEEFSNNFFHNNNIKLDSKGILVVDLDSSMRLKSVTLRITSKSYITLNAPEEENERNLLEDWFNIELPPHYTSKLIKRVNQYIVDSKGLQTSDISKKQEYNFTLRDHFYKFIFSILKDYGKFIRLDEMKLTIFDSMYISKNLHLLNISDIFQDEEFLKQDTKNRDFYQRLINTKMFFDFIMRKIYPTTLIEKVKIVLFDEKIVAKKNKSLLSFSKPTPFINSSDFSDGQGEFGVTRKNNYSAEECVFIANNLNKCIKYFQDISISLNRDNQKKKSEKIFNILYLIFPKLLYDNEFFPKTYEQLCLTANIMPKFPQDIMKKFESFIANEKNLEMYKDTQYKLDLYNSSEVHKLSMRKIIELCWVFLCGGILWSCDSAERDFRIQSIFEVLEDIQYIEDDIILFAFLSIIRWGKDYQVIKMYELMEKYDGYKDNYTLFSLLCMKMTKIFNNYKTRIKKEAKRATLISRETEMILMEEKEVKFRKRSLLNKLGVQEEIKFENVILCPKCFNEYEIDFKKILTEPRNSFGESFKCTHCSNKEKREKFDIRVMIGDDENHLINVTLISPSVILDELKKHFIRNEDYKIDIEVIRVRYQSLFYSLILFFGICNLSYDFMIPYELDNKNIYNHRKEIIQKDRRWEFSNLKIENVVSEGIYPFMRSSEKRKTEKNDMTSILKSKTLTVQLYKSAEMNQKADLNQKKSKDI